MTSNSNRTASAASVLISSSLLNKLIDLAMLGLLARLLSTADFGLVAAAMTPVLIVQTIMEVPIGSAVVRLPSIEKAHLNTAFTVGLIRGGLVFSILVATCWPYAHYIRDDRLPLLLLALSFSPLFRALTSVGLIEQTRELKFAPTVISETSSKAIGALAGLAHALVAPSYWSIATMTIATSFSLFATSYLVAPFSPRISLAKWHDLASVTGWGFVTQGLAAFSWQVDKLVLGRYVPKPRLGEFSIASDISALPHQALVIPMTRPVLPVFAKLLADGRPLDTAYSAANGAILSAVGPVYVLMATFSSEFVGLLAGQKWQGAANLLPLLAMSGIPPLIVASFSVLVTATNKNRLQAAYSITEALTKIPAVIVLSILFGTYGAAGARLASSVLNMLVLVQLGKMGCGISRWSQFRPQLRILFCLAVMGAAGWVFEKAIHEFIPDVPLLIQTFVGSLMTLLVYGSLLFGSWHLSGRPKGLEPTLLHAWTALIRRFHQ